MTYKIISSDSHVFEPPDLWVTRLPVNYRDRAPHVVYGTGEEPDYWYIDGKRSASMAVGAEPGKRFEGQEKLRLEAKQSEVLKGAYIPGEKLKDMALDGVWGEVVYPTVMLGFWRSSKRDLVNEVIKVYNTWIAEFAGAYPDRIKALGIVDLYDIAEGIKEVQRCAKLGLVGALINVHPGEGNEYSLPMYDPFWAAAQDCNISLSLHLGANRYPPNFPPEKREKEEFSQLFATPSLHSTTPHWPQLSIADMIFAGVFERYPKLKVLSVENEVAWAAHFIRLMDYTYSQRTIRPNWRRFKPGVLPSDFFHSNVLVSFQEDDLGVRLRDIIGVENLMWGSDYPHQESTFPKSREFLAKMFQGVPEAEQAKIACWNTAKLYGFNPPAQ